MAAGGTWRFLLWLLLPGFSSSTFRGRLELASSHLTRKVIWIQATRDISVAWVNYKGYTVGATTVLPVGKLGTKYYVVTPEDNRKEGLKEFVVAAGKTPATVSILPKGKLNYEGRTHPPGSTLQVSLDAYQSLQLQSSDDLTGTEVTSDNVVAVLSGHTCVKINSGCDFVVEQLLPVVSWGTTYVVPPNPLQTNVDFTYVVAANKGSITYSQGEVVHTKSVEAGEVLKLEMGRKVPLYLSASFGLQVVYFFTGFSKIDPFLLNIPPISTHCTSYHVSSLNGFYNHVTLVAPSADASAITLNRKMDRTISWQEIPGTSFSWATITMRRSGEIKSAEHPETPFGLLVFGYESYLGFGFAGLCATISPSLSCKDLGCKKCEVVDDHATCIPETTRCWASGGPHYHTFDGKSFDFMGTCTYVLTKSCDPDPNLPIFSIEVQKEDRDNPQLSPVGSVTVHVYDLTVVVVRLEKGFVRVNNLRSRLPISLADGKLHLQQKGKFLQLQTSFHLKVLYDWADHVVVTLPRTFSGKVCGLCGNSNGDPRDDALKPDGQLVQDLVELGQSWKVANESRCCQDNCNGACGRCQPAEEATYKGDTWCGLLTQQPGPFESCHGLINPEVYLENCVHDLCASHGLQAKLCQALETYAHHCQEEGITLSDWRTPAHCALSCPQNSTYTSCGSPCPSTCNVATTPPTCPTTPCLETCQCQEGLVLDAHQCIPQDQCGCVFEGLLYGPGEEFWGDTTCTKRCVCHARSRRSTCHQGRCQAGQECRVERGIRGCYPRSYGTCTATGATHYETFDGGRFVFQGTCVYQLVGLCRKSRGLVDFQVLVQNGHQDKHFLASIAVVMVKVYGQTIVISQENPGKVLVNDQLANLPYQAKDRRISISRGGLEAVVETDFGLTLTYDWRSQVTVRVPSTYTSTLCGLCGNFNGKADDEMKTRNGRVTSHPDTLGRSWRVTTPPGCLELSKVECPTMAAAQRQQEASEMGCGIILEEDGPFGACHIHVDPKSYFQSCLHDLCLFPEQEDMICPIIARYVAACQAEGVSVGTWRTEKFCSVLCPTNSHYELCHQDCDQTCPGVPVPARRWGRCREGCACDRGFVLSGDQCVPRSLCGCHHQGFYYQLEETFYPSKQEQCQCRAGGVVDCQKPLCPGGGEGEVIDGVFQCPPATLGTCVATGDRSYVSFDGVAFNSSGTCSYILTETCAGEDVNSFVVTIEKDPRQKRKVSGIQALSVEVYGLMLTFTRSRRGAVMVDSISHNLPAILSEGRVQVHHHGMGVLLQTDFGLVILYDLLQHVMVTVPQTFQGHLCGLCGNYNGQRDDDLLLPGGQEAPNMVAFSSAWRTTDVPCSEDCPKATCPTCTEEKVVALQTPNYCGLLKVPDGPFSSCHHLIDPNFYFQSCVHDLCLAEGDTQVLCRSIQSYATACQHAGVVIKAWRRPSFCPLPCPPNSTYTLCTNHCSRTCPSLADATTCPQTCLEGCQCPPGTFFTTHGCVPRGQCGCFQNGTYYQTPTNRCCPPRPTADETCDVIDGVRSCVNNDPCKALGCRSKERCHLKDGQAKCVPSLVATCWAWGDPHYHTFDGLDFDFEGTCTYTMAESYGNDTTLEPFKVEAKNSIQDGVKSISYISLVKVKVYGHQVSIHQGEVGKIRVDGEVALLPVALAGGRLRGLQRGGRAVLEAPFGLRVTYDWRWHLLLDLPSSYHRHVRGLCGDFNLRPHDDVPGQDVPTLVAWASTWRTSSDDDDDPFCWDHCEGSCPVCPEDKKELYGGNQYCGLLKKRFQGPFRACHDIINPRDFYRNCLYDVCMSGGAQQVLCQVLDSYAVTCRRSGAAVEDWRTPAKCPLPCPPNSHYEPCGSACPATCSDPEAPATCPHPCLETCACDPGHVLSGGLCVALAQCGCTHDGRYHPPGQEFWGDTTCQRRCRCDPTLGIVLCQPGKCRDGEKCLLVEGTRRCVATKHLVCVASGDPHYTTFDGHRFDFMGSCVYQLAALCSPHPPGLVPFNVTVENDHRGSRAVSFTKEVTLSVYNISLSLSREHPQKLK
ncbi:PREDICTED: IgGFc-binding protein-like, partial [Chaetura pelagica]